MEVGRRCLEQDFPLQSKDVCYPTSSLGNLFLFCFKPTGVLQLMEIGDVQKKDIVDHPENYSLLTTLDEGLSQDTLWPPIPPRKQPCDHCFLCFRVVEEVQRGGRTPGKGLSGCHLWGRHPGGGGLPQSPADRGPLLTLIAEFHLCTSSIFLFLHMFCHLGEF